MRWQLLLLVLVGIVAAGSAAVLVASLKTSANIDGTRLDASPLEPQLIKIVTAATSLEPGTTVEDTMVKTVDVRAAQVPAGAFNDPVQVVGQVLVTPMVAGQAFIKASFAADGPGVYLAATLPPGMRAMSVSLSDYSSLDGLLYPGCAVDVLASFDMRGKGDSDAGVLSATILRGVQVLAIEDRTAVSSEKSEEATLRSSQRRRVTLMVSPKQAEELQLAMEHGVISLALRNPKDRAIDPNAENLTRLSELGPTIPEAKPVIIEKPVYVDRPVVQPVAERPKDERKPEWKTIVMRGGESSVRTFTVEERPAKADSKK